VLVEFLDSLYFPKEALEDTLALVASVTGHTGQVGNANHGLRRPLAINDRWNPLRAASSEAPNVFRLASRAADKLGGD
jgi:hypothetical protein